MGKKGEPQQFLRPLERKSNRKSLRNSRNYSQLDLEPSPRIQSVWGLGSYVVGDENVVTGPVTVRRRIR
ncbi:hypothetical protein ACTXT7_011908 [Hymenolepis weldensis]